MENIGEIADTCAQIFAQQQKLAYEAAKKENEIMAEGRRIYREKIGEERYGDMMDLANLVCTIRMYFNNPNNTSLFDIETTLELLSKIKVVKEIEDLHSYEVGIVFDYKKLLKDLNDRKQQLLVV